MNKAADKQARAWHALGLGPRWQPRRPAIHLPEEVSEGPTADRVSGDLPAIGPVARHPGDADVLVPESTVPAPGLPDASAPDANPAAPAAPAGVPPDASAAAPAVMGAVPPDAGSPRLPAPEDPVAQPGVALGTTPTEGWQPLRERVAQCRACSLCETRRQVVFGVGDERADWLIVGEAPGAEEDRRGEPFVGEAGQLLDQMLASIGLSRAEGVFILNVLKCRPPGNRDPLPEEVAQCRPFLEAQISLLRPAIILAVGRFAAHALLGSQSGIGSLRGRAHGFELGGRTIPVVVTYHPAYYLRRPEHKRLAWEDLCRARALAATTPTRD
ncbi:MAG: uracil-DNA glycosylase [Burkholderiaceae bacterium]